MLSRALSAGALLVCCWACSVDDRVLEADSSGASGAAHGGSAGRPATSGGSSSKAGSRPTIDDVPIPNCAYGSGGVAPECATLVQNPGFDTDTRAWDLDGGVHGLWREADAAEAPSSGSIDVLNTLAGTDRGVAPGSARQCLPATPGQIYDLAGDVFVAEQQGDGDAGGGPYEGAAVLGAFFFDDDNCKGTSVGFVNADAVSKTGEWVHVTATAIAPELTGSISVRLNALKPIREYTFTATFDNVFVRER